MTPEERAVIDAAMASHRGCAIENCGGSRLDPCRLGNAIEALQLATTPAPPAESQWVATTMLHCLAGDRIRIGAEETTVLRSNAGMWHADVRDAWRPKAWPHVELRMELEAVPGFQQYPPNASVEILCTPERHAVLMISEQFPGSAVISSDVD